VSDDCGVTSLVNDYNLSDTLTRGTTIPIEISETSHQSTKIIRWTVHNKSGAQSSCSVNIIVAIDDEIQPLSAFSPNGDGINDEWKIINIERYPDATVQIFNRWGTKIFEAENNYAGNMWNGQNLPIDTYHYIIAINNKTIKRGIVTIIK